MAVVLPAPLGPKSPTISPRETLRERSLKANTSPYFLDNPIASKRNSIPLEIKPLFTIVNPKAGHIFMKQKKVAAFEARLGLKMKKLIEKHQAIPLVASVLKEIPLTENKKAFEVFSQISSDVFDYIILLTGVGTRTFIETLSTHIPKEKIIEILSQQKIIVRGPKPATVCNLNKIPIVLKAPEPNTWKEILSSIQDHFSIHSKKILIIEYGTPNEQLILALTTLGAHIHTLSVYRWSLPDDLKPAREVIEQIIQQKVDFVLFTSAIQVDHMLQIAQQMKKELPLRKGLYHSVIASIGPVTSERLAEKQIFPDIESFPNKMEDLVEIVSQKGPKILDEKQKKKLFNQTSPSFMRLTSLLKPTPIIPVWFMRQAGRYMTEYQLVRAPQNFLSFCKDADLCIEATLGAVERLGVDAAIIFSDILLVLEPMGFKLHYPEGPAIDNPIQSPDDLKNLKPVSMDQSLPFLKKAIQGVKKNLPARIPLIGFCGAPFTMASYIIEGGSTKDFKKTKHFMQTYPKAWHELMEQLTNNLASLLLFQIKAGCEIVQVFDSWASQLSPQTYQAFALPYTQKLFSLIPSNIPAIHFGSFGPNLLSEQIQGGGNIISLHSSIDPRMAVQIIPENKGIQGNLNPDLLFEKPSIFLKETEKILQVFGKRKGYIFNLGHGIKPHTPVNHVMRLVDFIHEWSVKNLN